MPRIRFASILALLVLTAAATASPVSAQRRVSSGSSGARGFFMLGAQYMELEDLNSELVLNGYPEFDEVFLTLGGGGFAVRNRLVIGGEGHALIQSEETTTNGQFRTGVFGAFGMFNLGYQVVQSGGLSIYPLVGVGGGGVTLRIREREVVSFDEVLNEPGREAQLSNGGLLVGGALGLDWFFASGPGRGGFVLGLRAGYNYSPLQSDWHIAGTDVSNGPETSLSGAFVRVSLGGGRR